MSKITKPPLGLIPREFIEYDRYIEICKAIVRYYNANIPIPIIWIEEYNELVVILKDKL